MKKLIIKTCHNCPFIKLRKKQKKLLTFICTLSGGKAVESLYNISSFCPLFDESEIDRVSNKYDLKRCAQFRFKNLKEVGK